MFFLYALLATGLIIGLIGLTVLLNGFTNYRTQKLKTTEEEKIAIAKPSKSFWKSNLSKN